MFKATYQLNERVIFRGQGVAEIVNIIERDNLDYYVLKVFDKDVEFMVPINNNSSLRKPIPKTEVADIFSFLEDKNFTIKKTNWNKRLREYTEKLKSGSIYDVATILKELSFTKKNKKLSFSEDKIYRQAKELIVQELSISDGTSKSVTEFKVEECLK
jgi:CarD family transcriptional regulator